MEMQANLIKERIGLEHTYKRAIEAEKQFDGMQSKLNSKVKSLAEERDFYKQQADISFIERSQRDEAAEEIERVMRELKKSGVLDE